jgi:hypothetical protein
VFCIQAIRQLRDRALLEQYERTLVPNSPAWFFAGRLKADTVRHWSIIDWLLIDFVLELNYSVAIYDIVIFYAECI